MRRKERREKKKKKKEEKREGKEEESANGGRFILGVGFVEEPEVAGDDDVGGKALWLAVSTHFHFAGVRPHAVTRTRIRLRPCPKRGKPGPGERSSLRPAFHWKDTIRTVS